MPNTYAMDVCYKSDVELWRQDTSNNPISMACGFIKKGPETELGSIINLGIQAGDQMYFSFLDIAAQAAPISKIEIQCDDVTNGLRNPTRNVSPFVEWASGTYNVSNPVLGGSRIGSGGCNMQGFGLTVGPFTAKAPAGSGRRVKTYEITVTITLTNGRVFKVDPEVDVMAE